MIELVRCTGYGARCTGTAMGTGHCERKLFEVGAMQRVEHAMYVAVGADSDNVARHVGAQKTLEEGAIAGAHHCIYTRRKRVQPCDTFNGTHHVPIPSLSTHSISLLGLLRHTLTPILRDFLDSHPNHPIRRVLLRESSLRIHARFLSRSAKERIGSVQSFLVPLVNGARNVKHLATSRS